MRYEHLQKRLTDIVAQVDELKQDLAREAAAEALKNQQAFSWEHFDVPESDNVEASA
jgi:Skp family chaperone for outer membrane proteins